MNTAEILQRLQGRYAAPEWAYFEQIRDAAGFHACRTADAIAMNLWPSRGLEVHGFEVKVSRADWRKEMKNPAKAEAVSQFCDRWWVVVGDAAIVKEGELPPTWGLLVPRGKGLAKKVDAPQLEPEPMDKSFVAALLKRASESKHYGTVQRRVDTEVNARMKDVNKDARKAVEQQLNDARAETDHWQEAVQAFEAASGVEIEKWNAGNIGEAAGWSCRSRPPRGEVRSHR
jgi:hypothetical protein